MKIELFDYEFQPDKKIVEIQGPDHYCVGPASTIYHEELKKNIKNMNLIGMRELIKKT